MRRDGRGADVNPWYFTYILKNIALKKKKRETKKGEGMEGPEKPVSYGWRRCGRRWRRERGLPGSQPHLPVCGGRGQV